MLPFQPHCGPGKGYPGSRPGQGGLRGGPWILFLLWLTPGTTCRSLSSSGQPSPQHPPLHFWISTRAYRIGIAFQHKLKTFRLILPWSWQEAGWEYATERKMTLPDSSVSKVKKRSGLRPKTDRLPNSPQRWLRFSGACPHRNAWDSSWVWVPLAGSIPAVSNSFYGNCMPGVVEVRKLH